MKCGVLSVSMHHQSHKRLRPQQWGLRQYHPFQYCSMLTPDKRRDMTYNIRFG